MLTNCLAECAHLSSTVPQLFEQQAHIFVSPGDAPATIMQYVVWMERDSTLAKPLAACTYLSLIVSKLYDA